MRWGAATDTGRVRVENEDNYLAADRAFVVADGMGGHKAGEVAAALTVDLLRTRLSQPGAALDDVVAAVSDANRDIFQAAAANPEHQGMGTTVTGLVLLGADERRRRHRHRRPSRPRRRPRPPTAIRCGR